MAANNKVFLIGRLTKDVSFGTTQSGKSFARFDIAINSMRQGEETTDYFRVDTWNRLAENCNKMLNKGDKVAVVGALQNRKYVNKDGVEIPVTEIRAEEIEFLELRKQTPEEAVEVEVEEDDMPF